MRHGGFEPPTTWLKVKCSTNWASIPYILFFVVLAYERLIWYHENISLSILFLQTFINLYHFRQADLLDAKTQEKLPCSHSAIWHMHRSGKPDMASAAVPDIASAATLNHPGYLWVRPSLYPCMTFLFIFTIENIW